MTLRRIKLKVGAIEIEVEGEQSDLEKVAFDLLDRASSITATGITAVATSQNNKSHYSGNQSAELVITGKSNTEGRKITMASLAAERNCKTGPELARLACEYLHFVKSKHVFDRHEVLAEMRNVTSIYKKSFKANVYHYHLKSLASKGLLREYDSGNFSLTAKAVKSAKTYFSKLA